MRYFITFYDSKMKGSLSKTTQATTLSMITPQKISEQKFDGKFIEMALSTAYQMIQNTELQTDDHNVMSDYQQLQYAIDAIHTYLYERKNSHLNEKDAQIFADYLVQKMKNFQGVIDKIANKK